MVKQAHRAALQKYKSKAPKDDPRPDSMSRSALEGAKAKRNLCGHACESKYSVRSRCLVGPYALCVSDFNIFRRLDIEGIRRGTYCRLTHLITVIRRASIIVNAS